LWIWQDKFDQLQNLQRLIHALRQNAVNSVILPFFLLRYSILNCIDGMDKNGVEGKGYSNLDQTFQARLNELLFIWIVLKLGQSRQNEQPDTATSAKATASILIDASESFAHLTDTTTPTREQTDDLATIPAVGSDPAIPQVYASQRSMQGTHDAMLHVSPYSLCI
jgi:hypothetical protein